MGRGPARAVVLLTALVVSTGCDDAGADPEADGGRSDAMGSDAGPAPVDAGPEDAAADDAGTADGAARDAGAPDAGPGCTPAACDDGVACTDDECDAAGACVHVVRTDADGDGSAAFCLDAAGALLGGDDCDDGDASRHPGALDGPGSDDCACEGIDNDCDGTPDEGCGCLIGYERECGSAAALMRVGICRPGTQRCDPDLCHWTEDCEGEIRPAEETCDGTDQDCDGTVDESVCD